MSIPSFKKTAHQWIQQNNSLGKSWQELATHIYFHHSVHSPRPNPKRSDSCETDGTSNAASI